MSPFENVATDAPETESDPSRENGQTDFERMSEIAERLKGIATDFQNVVEPGIAFEKKGDKANWLDAALLLYGAAEYAIPRLEKGFRALQEIRRKKD